MRILLPGAASDPARRGSRAARNFKRKVLQEDIIREVKRHAFYLKPGQKLRVKQAPLFEHKHGKKPREKGAAPQKKKKKEVPGGTGWGPPPPPPGKLPKRER